MSLAEPTTLSKAAAARRLGLSRPALYAWLKRGTLAADARGRIPVASITELLQSPPAVQEETAQPGDSHGDAPG